METPMQPNLPEQLSLKQHLYGGKKANSTTSQQRPGALPPRDGDLVSSRV
jgi:hypothetical protein